MELGVSWLMSLSFGQFMSVVAVCLYQYLSSDRGSDATMSPDAMWTLIGGLESVFVVCFALFIATIDAKYRMSFCYSVNAIEFSQAKFQSATRDQTKLHIFSDHESYWADIKVPVELWVRENWERLNEEQPEWFTDRVKARVPKYMIPQN